MSHPIPAHAVDYMATTWAHRHLPTCFLAAAPVLRELERVSVVPEGDLLARAGRKRWGMGYAVVQWAAHELLGAERDVAHAVIERLELAAALLGQEVDAHLRGKDEDRSFNEAVDAAGIANIGIAVAGVTAAAPGDRFLHLGELPHLARDDGRFAMRAPWSDAVTGYFRFFGIVAPAAVAVEAAP